MAEMRLKIDRASGHSSIMSAAVYTPPGAEPVQRIPSGVGGIGLMFELRSTRNPRVDGHVSAHGIPDRHLRCAFRVRFYAVTMPASDVGLLPRWPLGPGVLLRSWGSYAPYRRQEASRILDASFQSRTGDWPQTRPIPGTAPCPQNAGRRPARCQRGNARRSARLLGRDARRPRARTARNGG